MLYSSFCPLQLILSQLSGIVKRVFFITIFCKINNTIFIVELKEQLWHVTNLNDHVKTGLSDSLRVTIYSTSYSQEEKYLGAGLRCQFSDPRYLISICL